MALSDYPAGSTGWYEEVQRSIEVIMDRLNLSDEDIADFKSEILGDISSINSSISDINADIEALQNP